MISRKYNEQVGAYLAKLAQSKPKPQTNADRIRTMSDEELAEWIHKILKSNIAPWATVRGADKRGNLLDWLKQEATENA